MKQYQLRISIIAAACILLFPAAIFAQKENKIDKEVKVDKELKEKKEAEQIIITKKGEGKDKIVIEINGDDVTINGKPVDDYKDKEGNVTIRRNRIRGDNNWSYMVPGPGGQRGGVWNFSDDDNARIFQMDENLAMLGVVTEKAENGVKVNDVTKESAAQKIGLKEGDIITKIDDQKISDPDELSTTIRKHKPGDKVNVTYIRDKKEQTATAELTKWKGLNTFSVAPGQHYNIDMGDMNFEKIMPKIQSIPQLRGLGESWNWSGGSPKLGISVQDTDEGNGVKVIGIDDESNAAKAGIKEDDIITEVDGKIIKGTDDIVKVIKESKNKSSVMMKLLRKGKTQNIEVKMPKKIKTADL
jgi:serine protease Do